MCFSFFTDMASSCVPTTPSTSPRALRTWCTTSPRPRSASATPSSASRARTAGSATKRPSGWTGATWCAAAGATRPRRSPSSSGATACSTGVVRLSATFAERESAYTRACSGLFSAVERSLCRFAVDLGFALSALMRRSVWMNGRVCSVFPGYWAVAVDEITPAVVTSELDCSTAQIFQKVDTWNLGKPFFSKPHENFWVVNSSYTHYWHFKFFF